MLSIWLLLRRPVVNASESYCAKFLEARLDLFWSEDWPALWARVRAECDVAPVFSNSRKSATEQKQSRVRKVATLAQSGERGRALAAARNALLVTVTQQIVQEIKSLYPVEPDPAVAVQTPVSNPFLSQVAELIPSTLRRMPRLMHSTVEHTCVERVMCECLICACSLTVKLCVCVVFSSAFMDRLFASVIQGLPRELHEALTEAEHLDSCVLDAYPLSSAEELGLVNVTHHPARIRRTRKGAGLQSVGITSLTAGVDPFVGESTCTATPTVVVPLRSVFRSVEPESLASAVSEEGEVFDAEKKPCFPVVSCLSEFRGSSENPRQCQPVSSTDRASSKNARQSQPGSSSDMPTSSEVFTLSADQVALDTVAVTLEKVAGHDVAPSGVGIVLKSGFPTVCPAGIFETAARASSKKSVKSVDVKSCSSPVLCQPHHEHSKSIPDETLLFHTLVRDGVLQLAFQEDFEKLARAAQTSANRHRRQRAGHGNIEAALELHEHTKKAREQERVQKKTLDQFAAAANLPQRRYHARYQSSLDEGPTARRDAEDAERLRWVTLLGELPNGTQTPMGQVLSTKPGNLQLFGGGMRASTLRSRVRGVQKFLSWLATHQEKVFPDSAIQLLEFLQVRSSEPCNQGSLTGSHRALVFLEKTAGAPSVERLTNTQLYSVSYKELLSSASPARTHEASTKRSRR